MDIEKYDIMPSKLGMKFRQSPTKPKRIRKEYGYYHQDDIWNAISVRLPSLVGKDWDEVYSILTKVYNTINTSQDKKETILRQVTMPALLEDGRVEVSSYRGTVIYASLDVFKRKYQDMYNSRVIYYVDPQTNLLEALQRKPVKAKVSKQAQIEARRRVVHNKLERRRHDKLKDETSQAMIRMINRRDLFDFYLKLLAKKSSLLSTIYARPKEQPTIKLTRTKTVVNPNAPNKRWRRRGWYGKYMEVKEPVPYHVALNKLRQDMNWWRMCERSRIADAKKAREELVDIQEQIDHLEAGRYDVYFKSNVYLYSIQKECHHVATP